MIDHPDFLPMPKSKTDVCYCRGCTSIPGKDQYYLTEWDIITGASSTFSFCEKCILKHSKNLVLQNGEIDMQRAQTTKNEDIMNKIEKLAKQEQKVPHKFQQPLVIKERHGIINGVRYKTTTHPNLQRKESTPNQFFAAKDKMGNYIVRSSKRSIGAVPSDMKYIRFFSTNIEQACKDVELLENYVECPVSQKKMTEVLKIPETTEPLATATTIKDAKLVAEKQEPHDNVVAQDLTNRLNKIVRKYEIEMETLSRNFQRNTGLNIQELCATIIPTEHGMSDIKIKLKVGLM